MLSTDQATIRHEKGKWIRRIKFELARSERVRPGTEKRHLFVVIAKRDPVLTSWRRDVEPVALMNIIGKA